MRQQRHHHDGGGALGSASLGVDLQGRDFGYMGFAETVRRAIGSAEQAERAAATVSLEGYYQHSRAQPQTQPARNSALASPSTSAAELAARSSREMACAALAAAPSASGGAAARSALRRVDQRA